MVHWTTAVKNTKDILLSHWKSTRLDYQQHKVYNSWGAVRLRAASWFKLVAVSFNLFRLFLRKVRTVRSYIATATSWYEDMPHDCQRLFFWSVKTIGKKKKEKVDVIYEWQNPLSTMPWCRRRRHRWVGILRRLPSVKYARALPLNCYWGVYGSWLMGVSWKRMSRMLLGFFPNVSYSYVKFDLLLMG